MMEFTDVVIIPVIVGLVALLKHVQVPTKLLPIASLALGLLGGIFYIYPEDLKSGILVGLIMGLAASGFYSGGKTVIEKSDK